MTFKKYPDIERLGHEDNQEILKFQEDTLVIEEKVDGGNGSFWLEEDGIIHFGSRNRDLTLEGDNKMFALYQSQLRSQLEDLEKQGIKLNPDYIYYIEWMQKHTISYTKAPIVIGLDIRHKRSMDTEDSGLFISRESKEQEFRRLNIEVVPLVWRGTVGDLKKLNINDLIPQSKYFDGKAEGIVIKNYNRMHRREHHQLYAKLVREEFKEDNKAVFGGVRQKESDTQRIIIRFCTEARIRKAIFKFLDEGEELSLKLMAKVPRYVLNDILKEEFSTIAESYNFLDFKEMRQKIPKLCLNAIKEMMRLKEMKE